MLMMPKHNETYTDFPTLNKSNKNHNVVARCPVFTSDV